MGTSALPFSLYSSFFLPYICGLQINRSLCHVLPVSFFSIDYWLLLLVPIALSFFAIFLVCFCCHCFLTPFSLYTNPHHPFFSNRFGAWQWIHSKASRFRSRLKFCTFSALIITGELPPVVRWFFHGWYDQLPQTSDDTPLSQGFFLMSDCFLPRGCWQSRLFFLLSGCFFP